ncbi:hypothetical protein V502_06831 [Pseudogymnoascus sp. VKM F-4520 (FW-2644)]|nr:hypothetical protein V502_06831 [Pseudogymnoascus sp. VKM F-4520 (FW-2644)]
MSTQATTIQEYRRFERWNACARTSSFRDSVIASLMPLRYRSVEGLVDHGPSLDSLRRYQWSSSNTSSDQDSEEALNTPSSEDGDRHITADRSALSQSADADESSPELFHRVQHDSSILALTVSDKFIYAGTQDGDILAWSLASYELVARIKAHKRAVLCLTLSQDGQFLFSGAGDAIVNAWCPYSLKRKYHIYSTYDVGDIFSVAYSTQFQTIYLGAQNTSIQWCSLKDSDSRQTPNEEGHPDKRNHRFFDSKQAGAKAPTRSASPGRSAELATGGEILEIDQAHMKHYAHFGYVYCMLMVRGASRLVEPDEEMLISGGGDGSIKLWKLSEDPDDVIEEIACLGEDDAESVLSLALDGSFLYSGKLRGVIELWDLDTKQKLRVIKAHNGDVMALQMGWGFLFSAGATGFSRKYSTVQYGQYNRSSENFSQKYQCMNRWKSHEGKVMASATTNYNGQRFYITGASDNSVSIWNFSENHPRANSVGEFQEDVLIKSLQEFVSYKTISSRPDHAEDCRRGATFLRKLFKKYGAETEMLNTDNHHNPVVFARFSGKQATSAKRKKILFYGHYDVVGADDKKGNWIIDPFQMKGINGYLYGRGVSDNKGPIMAALYAVVDCKNEGLLDSDVIFLIEGEEESGSRGFMEAVKRNKELIGDIDYILLANSYWLDDDVPCLTYGLRGVLHATISVDSNHPDVHSGVDGSFMMDEPLFDLTSILSELKGRHNHIKIPGFYDNILPVTEAEEARYDDITDTLIRRNPELGPASALKASLMARWRQPNLTVHRYKVSGPEGSLVSCHASAAISLRLVPNQEVEDVIESLKTYLNDAFQELDTHNHLTITIDNQAEPWLGNPDNAIFQTLEKAIMEVWGPIDPPSRPSQPAPASNLRPPRPTSSQTAATTPLSQRCASLRSPATRRRREGSPCISGRAAVSPASAFWRRSLEPPRRIYPADRRAIARIWIMSGCG